MIVNVTQAHIDAGKPGSCSACPVALAVADALGYGANELHCRVTVSEFEIRTPNEWVRTPQSVVDFIAFFDISAQRGGVKPFSFDLDLCLCLAD